MRKLHIQGSSAHWLPPLPGTPFAQMTSWLTPLGLDSPLTEVTLLEKAPCHPSLLFFLLSTYPELRYSNFPGFVYDGQ